MKIVFDKAEFGLYRGRHLMTIVSIKRRMMRTPVLLVTGQGDTDAVVGTLIRQRGTLVVEHRFDGQVVRRTLSELRDGDLRTSEYPLELARGCVSCTIRNDLLVLLRQLHRRDDVDRIVVHAAPWLEPEPICWAVNHVRVRVGPGYVDGPAARDVSIEAVVNCVDAHRWAPDAVGDGELVDGRTVAQVLVGQAEFADVQVLSEPEPTVLAVLRRLAPRARITVGAERVAMALRHLDAASRRGRETNPHDPLLAGEPPLAADGEVSLVEFTADRPFHPQRLHAAVDMLLAGVVRTRGRAWLANRGDDVMWIESAGGGLRIGNAGTWLAAMDSQRSAYADPQRWALSATHWHDRWGDRHTSMTVLVCGARPDEILGALRGALLTDDELARPGDWPTYDDPFGDWHEDPCDELPDRVTDGATQSNSEGDER
jgi:G3E family GTPase